MRGKYAEVVVHRHQARRLGLSLGTGVRIVVGREYLERGEQKPEQEPDKNGGVSELPGRVRPAPLQPPRPKPCERDDAPEDQNVYQRSEHAQADGMLCSYGKTPPRPTEPSAPWAGTVTATPRLAMCISITGGSTDLGACARHCQGDAGRH